MAEELLISKDVELLWAARYDYRPGWTLGPHSHDDLFQMIYILDGAGTCSVGNEKELLKPETLHMIVPGKSHSITAGRKTAVRTLDVKFRIHGSRLKREGTKLGGIISCNASNRPKLLFESIREEGERKGMYFRETATVFLLELLLFLMGAEKKQTEFSEIAGAIQKPEDPMSRDLLNFLNDHFAENLSSDDIAAGVHTGYRNLSAHTSKQLGITPVELLARIRIDHARELLCYADYEIKNISQLVGFKTVPHFTRVFTKITGQSPAQWRNETRNGIGRDLYFSPDFVNSQIMKK